MQRFFASLRMTNRRNHNQNLKKNYTGTATFSMISFSTWSDCSDFFKVEA